MTNPNYLLSDVAWSSKNISSAISVYQYTVTGSSIWALVEVYLDGVTGSADYTMYMKRQLQGAGTSYIIVPKTTYTAEDGEHNFGFETKLVEFHAGDVIDFMALGQSADMSISGKIRLTAMNFSILQQSDILSDATPFAGANIDTPISSRSDFDESADQVIVATNNDKTGYALSAAGVDGIMDEVYEGTRTFRQWLRLAASVLFNKSTGGGTTTGTFRDDADSKARITATLDASGNRTAVILDDT